MSEIERLRGLLANATPGPWANQRQRPLAIVSADQAGLLWGGSVDPDQDRQRFAHPLAVVQLDDLTLRDNPDIAERFPHRRVHPAIAQADADLIVAAVNALPALLDVAEAAREAMQHRTNAPGIDTCSPHSGCAIAACKTALARLDGAS